LPRYVKLSDLSTVLRLATGPISPPPADAANRPVAPRSAFVSLTMPIEECQVVLLPFAGAEPIIRLGSALSRLEEEQ
jgi:hypothetical protein